MSIVYLPIEIANPKTPDKKVQIECLVDSGSHFSIVPKEILKKLSIIPHTKRSFLLANGEKMERGVGDALFFYEGSRAASPVIFGEREDATVVGVVTLESLGLVFNPIQRKLYPAKMMLAKVGEGEPQPLDNSPKEEQNSRQETAPEAGLEEAKPSEAELPAEEREKIEKPIEKAIEMAKNAEGGESMRRLKAAMFLALWLLAGAEAVEAQSLGGWGGARHTVRESIRVTARDAESIKQVKEMGRERDLIAKGGSLFLVGAAVLGKLFGTGQTRMEYPVPGGGTVETHADWPTLGKQRVEPPLPRMEEAGPLGTPLSSYERTAEIPSAQLQELREKGARDHRAKSPLPYEVFDAMKLEAKEAYGMTWDALEETAPEGEKTGVYYAKPRRKTPGAEGKEREKTSKGYDYHLK